MDDNPITQLGAIALARCLSGGCSSLRELSLAHTGATHREAVKATLRPLALQHLWCS